MPMQSQAQRGETYSAAAGKGNLGIPVKVAKEFVASDKPGKLPARKEEAGERGKDNERRERPHYRPLSHLAKRRDGY